ncbi:MAG TPA: hypothetical protein VK464_09315 [Symbiobacteriaceae bacterium]|jgi:hypothetical protein|nr:hypothetical protein [Symbiobacteriaceae bacterium]
MEDFQGAYIERALDTAALQTANRRVGTMHLGGMTIECLLKHMIVTYHRVRGWDLPSVREPGVLVTNPGHDVVAAARRMVRLQDRIDRNPAVRAWLQEIRFPGRLMHPEPGRVWVTFESARYDSRLPTDPAYTTWCTAYSELRKWLLEQMRTL